MEPWTKFRNLCQYYADCVRYSEKSQEYLFPDQLRKTFMLPRLPMNWHRMEDEFVVDTSAEDAFVRASLLKASDEDELFIGYPLNSFISPDGFECLCPVMMFPVSIAVRGPGYTTGMRMKIDRPGISINQDWVDYHLPRDEQKMFRRACEQTEDEQGCIDVDMVLNYIAANYETVSLNPNAMDFSVRNTHARESLLNTAVLFVGTKTKYTKNLLYELHRISKEPDEVLDGTSLAYVFRDPCLPNVEREGERLIPVSFLKRDMNAGQFDAVEASLNLPVVKVMGPPGTGKSFMSVNLIANEVMSGGSVLFTSKNHKAIHAIFDKAPEAVENKDFPLVSFCTTPDNPTNADWAKSQSDVDSRVSRIEDALHGNEHVKVQITPPPTVMNPGLAALDVALSSYRDAEQHIRRFQCLRDRISRFERLMQSLEAAVSKIPLAARDSSEVIKKLEEVEQLLSEEPCESWFDRICSCLGLIFHKQKTRIDLVEQLKDIAPSVASAIVSRSTTKKEVRRLLDLLRYRDLVQAWEKRELDAVRLEESQCNYEALKKLTKTALQNSKAVVQKAYEERMTLRVRQVEHSEILVATCKASSEDALRSGNLEFMASVDDGSRYEKAIGDFRHYLDVFPAWAATMLSLRRASPCLPGVFSLAIIDEASQCEIPPMIPVLYRARRVAVVGDPNQFPPVVTLKGRKDKAFRRKYRVDAPTYKSYYYSENNVFSVVPGKPMLLNEHFRCADGIAEYFNEEFYEGELSLCCDTGRTGVSAVGGLKPGMMWIDAPGGDDAEIEAALEYLKTLKRQDFKGSIGVISPLRSLANLLKTRVTDCRSEIPQQLDISSQINTANGFQGGECDVILFLLGLNGDRTHGQDWYITASENRYIYNVSVSRAKRVFVAFGDRKRVASCGLSYIQKLIPESRPPRKVNIGPGEERVRIALERSGITTVAQYPILGRYLDLAIPDQKIDIEIDGQAWHIDANGCRKADDIHRDYQLECAGWKVVRMWHHEVVNNITDCVKRVRTAIREREQKQ